MAIASLIVSLIAIVISAISVWYARKQYLSPIRPEVYINYFKIDQIKQEIVFFIQNRSENIAVLRDVKPKTKNLVLSQPILRYELTNDETKAYSVYCKYVGKDINHDDFKLKINYSDKENNKYSATLHAGKGSLYVE